MLASDCRTRPLNKVTQKPPISSPLPQIKTAFAQGPPTTSLDYIQKVLLCSQGKSRIKCKPPWRLCLGGAKFGSDFEPVKPHLTSHVFLNHRLVYIAA